MWEVLVVVSQHTTSPMRGKEQGMTKKLLLPAVAAIMIMMTAGCSERIRGEDVMVAQAYCGGPDKVKAISVSTMSSTGDKVHGVNTLIINYVVCNDEKVHEMKYTKNVGRVIIPQKTEAPRPLSPSM